MFEIRENKKQAPDGNDVSVLELGGHFDNVAAPKLKEALTKLTKENRLKIVVDCTKLNFISSAGIGAVLAVVHTIRAQGGDVKMCAMNEKVMTVFRLLGLEDVLESFPTLAEALKKYAA